ncbi:MAG TPA: hypothetical protein VEA81_01025 [Burkholderiaceae bacterium]|nr:hypothetical protein [Burkholderiaceae bacterium]
MLVESARYALLRRVAFAIRHQMVVHLQPIGMVTELLERRLRAPTPDLAQVHDGAAKIHSLHKAAVQDCLDVITWLAPEPGATITAEAAVEDAVTLLRSNFSFRAFNLRGEAAGVQQPIARAAGRMLLPAALLALTDPAEGPADVVITARPGEDSVVMEIGIRRTEGEPPLSVELPYRPMAWPEVVAIARSEDVELEHDEANARLTFPVLE